MVVQTVLTQLLLHNFPLVILTDALPAAIMAKVYNGSPIMLFDGDSHTKPIVAVAAPMRVHSKAEEFLTPDSLVNSLGYEAGGVHELVLRVLAAPITPIKWFKASTDPQKRQCQDRNVFVFHDPTSFNFNWGAPETGKKGLSAWNCHIPGSSGVTSMFTRPFESFRHIKNAFSDDFDFEGKLAALKELPPLNKGVGKAGRRVCTAEEKYWKELSEQDGNWMFYRRALMFKMALFHGDLCGFAHDHLCTVLPKFLLPTPRSVLFVMLTCSMPIYRNLLVIENYAAEIMRLVSLVPFKEAVEEEEPKRKRIRTTRRRAHLADSSSTESESG